MKRKEIQNLTLNDFGGCWMYTQEIERWRNDVNKNNNEYFIHGTKTERKCDVSSA